MEEGQSNIQINQKSEQLSQGSSEKKAMIQARLKETTLGFQLADWDKALEEKVQRSNRYYKGQEVSSCVKPQYFKMYGPGIYLFYRFILEASILFLILTTISIMPMVYNFLQGNAYNNSGTSLSVVVTRFSLGNYDYPTLQSSSSTPYNQSIQHKLFNTIPDLVCCVIFLVFYFYWTKKSEKIVKQISQEVLFPSYYAVEVVKFPHTANPIKIQEFMCQFGNVKEVAAVKFYAEKIDLCKDIYELEIKIKELQIEMKEDNSEKQQEKIDKCAEKIEELTEELNQHEDNYGTQYLKFYVSYETIEERDKVLETFLPHQKLCTCCGESPPASLYLDNFRVEIQPCEVQPGGLIWENIHITWRQRWLRFLVQFLIILLIIVGGFLFISLLNICYVSEEYPNIDTSSYTSTTILSQTNATIVQSWCIKSLEINNTSVVTLCYSYWLTYYSSIGITVAISLAVVVFKQIVKFTVIFVAKFQRYTNHTEQTKNITQNLLTTYISTTVLITFLVLMQANVFNISFKSFMKLFVTDTNLLSNLDTLTEYSDLTSSWYLNIGYQIWFNWLILAFVPHVGMPIVHCLLECLGQCLAKREILHKNMVKKMEPEEFELEDHYANVMMVIYIGFTFSAGMPFMLFVSLLGLVTRYIYFKYAFIRYSRVPKALSDALNHDVLRLLPAALISHCVLSIYMFGADDIFAPETSFLSTYLNSTETAVITEIATILERIVNTWYYSFFTAIFILAIILKNFVFDFIFFLRGEKKEQKEDKSQEQEGGDQDVELEQNKQEKEEVQIRSERALTKSYKLEKNPDYFEILAIMKIQDRKKKHKRESQAIVPVTPENLII